MTNLTITLKIKLDDITDAAASMSAAEFDQLVSEHMTGSDLTRKLWDLGTFREIQVTKVKQKPK